MMKSAVLTDVGSVPLHEVFDLALEPADPRLNVLKFLSMLRRDRAAILRAYPTPLDFCRALIDPHPTADIAYHEPLEGLAADMHDYAVSSAYALLIGDDRRKELSAYFTPPALTTATLDAIRPFLELGEAATILDPACGGGSFLVPTARRLIDMHIADGASVAGACAIAIGQLQGIEVDPGLAALSGQLLGRMILREYGVEYDTKAMVRCANTLQTTLDQRFDLIIGNPPYSKLFRSGVDQLTKSAGEADLGGHTNLYSLFVLKALDWLKPGGALAFVLPTSFVAGPYFAGLRLEIRKRARVVELAMHQQREDLFIDAIQDVCLLVLQRNQPDTADDPLYRLGWIDAAGVRTDLGTASAPADGEPWHLPLAPGEASTAHHHQLIADGTASTLENYGYRIRVGKVVPTRERALLFAETGKGRVPLLWASDIRMDGSFGFQSGKRTGASAWYAPLNPESAAYVCRRRAVLVQRTSNRDQRRRLNAAPMTKAFAKQHKSHGYVAENHVIVLEPLSDAPAVSQEVLAALLNSQIVNARFSAVSGSFSVSARLLARLALPDASTLPAIGDQFEIGLARAFGSIEGVLVGPARNRLAAKSPKGLR